MSVAGCKKKTVHRHKYKNKKSVIHRKHNYVKQNALTESLYIIF